ncbi:MAG: hypothetical protein Q9219_006454 [cf. Caloplaca sp. 3 TL-2023]
MGDSLVESIPTDPEEYQKWLHAMRTLFAKWDALLQTFLSVKLDSLSNIESDEALVGVMDEAFDARLEIFPEFTPAFIDGCIEYTYTFDLDHEVFSIDSSAHFRLQHIPRNGVWMEALCGDRQGRRFVHPRLAPEASLANLVASTHPFSTTNLADSRSPVTKEVSAKAAHPNISNQLRLKLFDVFEDSLIPGLSATLLSWTVDDLFFRELAFSILCLAAGGDHLSLVDRRRVLHPCWTEYYGVVVHGEGSEGERELITSVGSGFHLTDQPQGSAPSTDKYWFPNSNGALVCLINPYPPLEEAGKLEAAVADAINYGRDICGRTSFNALLISVVDLVLLRCFPDGSVEHSPIMSLMSTSGTTGKDARMRYSSSWLDYFYEKEMIRREKAARFAEEMKAKEKAEAAERKARRKAAAEKAAKKGDAQGPSEDVESRSSHVQSSPGSDTNHSARGETLACTEEPKQDDTEQIDMTVATEVEGADLAVEDSAETKATGGNAAMFVMETNSGKPSELTDDDDNAASPGPHEQTDGATREEVINKLTDGYADIALDDNVGEKQEREGPVEEITETHEFVEEDDEAKEERATEEEEEAEPKRNLWETGETFLSLVAFFNATALEALKPTYAAGQKLPIEIIEMILSHVFDVTTHNACMKVSRVFRSLCLERPVLVEGVRFIPPVIELEGCNCELHLHAEQSTGELSEVSIEKTNYYSKGNNSYSFVLGEEWNRRCFCPGTLISIKNLDTKAPLESNIHCSARRRMWPSGYRSEPGDGPWDRAREVQDVKADSDIRELGVYWENATRLMFPELGRGMSNSILQQSHDRDWLLPANTKQYLIETDFYYHVKYEQFLFLRIKRASRYWDCLWDDLIREMKDFLVRVNDSVYLKRRRQKGRTQLHGAADPEVILAVGLEIRLFKWNAADETLTERDPGYVYSVMDKMHRKVIEAVLNLAVARFRAAERKERPSYYDSDDSMKSGRSD